MKTQQFMILPVIGNQVLKARTTLFRLRRCHLYRYQEKNAEQFLENHARTSEDVILKVFRLYHMYVRLPVINN